MKKVFLFLTFLSFSFSFAKINHSLNFNLKKAEIDFKKSSIKSRILDADKINLQEINSASNKKLQAIVIKLDSVKELHQKKLLKQEVLTHTLFYKKFLIELKKANIKTEEYLFLENEILKISLVQKDKKDSFLFTVFLITLGGALMVFLFAFIYRRKKEEIKLTKQEGIIKNLALKGKTNKEIASELHISLSTVKTHLYNIYKKLNISNRNDLVIKHGK